MDNQNERNENKRDGTSRLFWILSFLDYCLFWVLIINFPSVMIFLACAALALSIYLRRKADSVRAFLVEMNRNPPKLEWIERWLSSWIVTSLLGIAMAYHLMP